MQNDTQTTAEFTFDGFLFGHGDQVTSIVSGTTDDASDDTILVSGSRDKTLIIWNLNTTEASNEFGIPYKCLTGHNHFVTDLTISNDNCYVISSSWDKTLRLWDIRYGRCMERFVGHTKEIHSVTFSSDNRQIFSGGSEKNIRIWNTLGECKVKSDHNNHTNWVSKIRYSSSGKNIYYASVGRDGRLKIWNGIFKLHASIKAHENYINALALSTNGQYIATGGKDKTVKIWNYTDLTAPTQEYKTESVVNDLAFNTKFQWIAAALENKILIWDIMNKDGTPFIDLEPEALPGADEGAVKPKCTCLAWSSNRQRLYVGCNDGVIRVYSINISTAD